MDKNTLQKMTVPKLREEALKIEGIVGVHGMSKAELLDILYDLHGIPREAKKQKDNASIKRKMVELRAKQAEVRAAGDKKQVEVLQKRIHDLKHRTRKA